MSDLQAIILLAVTTAATVGVLAVGAFAAADRTPRPRGRRTRAATPGWRRVARATWPAAWGMPPPPAAPTEPEIRGAKTRQDIRHR